MSGQERKPQSAAAPAALMVIGACIAWGVPWLGVSARGALLLSSVIGGGVMIAGFIWLLVRVAKDAEDAARVRRGR